MKFLFTLALLISIPFFSWNVATATEKNEQMSGDHPTMTVDDHTNMDEPMSEEHPVMTVDEHAVMDEPMSDEHPVMTENEHAVMDDQDKHGNDEEHEPLEESPANLKVLGTFAFINIGFILVGIWNKWIRKEKIEMEVL